MNFKKKIALLVLSVFTLSSIPFKAANASALATAPTRTSYEETDKNITYTGNWTSISNSNYSGGAGIQSQTANDTITLGFNGTGFALYGLVNASSGTMEVTIDNGITNKVDLYNGTTIYKQNIYEVNNLPAGTHTVKITVSSTKNINSKGTIVNLDSLEIINGTITEVKPPDPVVQFIGGTIISSTNNSTDGNYTLTATAPGKNAAVSYDILEGSTSIKSGTLTANADKDTIIAVDITNKADGTYNYKLILKNSKGETKESGVLTVIVKRGTTPPDPIKPTTSAKEVVTYFPNWGIYNSAHQTMQVSQIPWTKVTYVNHAFFEVDKNFKLASTDPDADFDRIMAHGEGWGGLNGHMAEYKYYKTQYPNVKVMISVGGWTRGQNFHEMAKTPASRKIFVDSCVDFLKKYPFIDGIDIDWEYPGVDRAKDPNDQYDYGCPGGPEDKENFPALLKDLREGFDNAGLSNKKLTAAVPAGKDKIDLINPSSYEKYLDIINVMTYDLHGAWEKTTGHHSQLYSTASQPYDDLIKNYYSVDAAMKQYVDAGVDRSKLIVGTPFYSRGWKGVDCSKGVTINGTFLPGLFQPATGAWTGSWDNPSVPGGQEGWFNLKKLETTAGWEKFRDPSNGAPYLINKSQGIFLTYEDETSLLQKLNYINDNNFGGIIIWDASGDSIASGYPLTTSCYNKLIKEPLDKLPVKVPITVDNQTNKGTYTLTAKIPANSKGTSFDIYEGNTIVKSGDVTTTAQTVTLNISNKTEGTYVYKFALKNSSGSMTSDSITVNVLDSTTPEPGTITTDKVVTEGDLVVTITAKDSLATDYKLYSNKDIVSQGKLVNGKATVTLSKIAFGDYIYKAELINATTNKSSFTNSISVKVKTIPPQWAPGVSYKAGDLVTFENAEYQCVIGHTSLSVWTPSGGGSTLWKKLS